MAKKETNSENHTARMGTTCMNEFNEILDKRLERKIDKKRKSIRVISELIVTHKRWPEMKKDAIEHKIIIKKRGRQNE